MWEADLDHHQLEEQLNSETNLVGLKDDWIYIPLDEEFTFVKALTYSFSALFLFCGLIYIWKQNYETQRQAAKQNSQDFIEF